MKAYASDLKQTPACEIINYWAISINKGKLARYWTCYTLGWTLISPPPPVELSENGSFSFASIRSYKILNYYNN